MGMQKNRGTTDLQHERFKQAAREAGADMDKDEFGRVIGGLAKPEPDEPKKPDQAQDE